MAESEKVTLEDIEGALETFNASLDDLVNNCQDPNTSAEAVRKVVLEVAVKPNKRRTAGTLTYKVKTSLAPPRPMEQDVFMGFKGGRGYLTLGDPAQMGIQEAIDQARAQETGEADQPENPKVAPIRGQG